MPFVAVVPWRGGVMFETLYYVADKVDGSWIMRAVPIRASYDDEDSREAAAWRLLGSETRTGGIVVLADLLGEDGEVVEQYEY